METGWGFVEEERFEYKVGANLRKGGIIYMIGSKMTDSSTLNPKVNSLMNLFLKREATQPLPVHKPAKKVKPNEEYLCPHQAKPATPSTIYYP